MLKLSSRPWLQICISIHYEREDVCKIWEKMKKASDIYSDISDNSLHHVVMNRFTKRRCAERREASSSPTSSRSKAVSMEYMREIHVPRLGCCMQESKVCSRKKTWSWDDDDDRVFHVQKAKVTKKKKVRESAIHWQDSHDETHMKSWQKLWYLVPWVAKTHTYSSKEPEKGKWDEMRDALTSRVTKKWCTALLPSCLTFSWSHQEFLLFFFCLSTSSFLCLQPFPTEYQPQNCRLFFFPRFHVFFSSHSSSHSSLSLRYICVVL